MAGEPVPETVKEVGTQIADAISVLPEAPEADAKSPSEADAATAAQGRRRPPSALRPATRPETVVSDDGGVVTTVAPSSPMLDALRSAISPTGEVAVAPLPTEAIQQAADSAESKITEESGDVGRCWALHTSSSGTRRMKRPV